MRPLFLVGLVLTGLLLCANALPPNRTRHGYGRHTLGNCGYDSCPTGLPNKLNVHIVAHTHDDVGWLKTVDQYFYGLNTNTQRAGVQYILDTVIPELLADPARRFIYVETAFFWKWWKQQSVSIRLIVIDLVESGRLEFIGGGFSMNDEATVHYNSVIDQMTWGHRRLVDTFGKCAVPRVAWQIDPFGHSREQASLFAQMYFDGLFFARVDYNDKTRREVAKEMEFVWQGSDELASNGDLFTGVLADGYGPPGGFCFDDTCGDAPIVDDPESEEYNVKQRVDQFIENAHNHVKSFATNHIMMTMGSDFNFQNARPWFKNLDKLIKYVNERGSDVNVFYSTPSCYLLGLNKANLTWSTKNDDFFPYASDPHAFWTGYFTSRPALKFYERQTNGFLQSVKQLQSQAKLHDNIHEASVIALKEAMGINQHHDAVSGTEKQHVANDYALQLNKGVLKCEAVINDAYQRLLAKSSNGNTPPAQSFCHALNVSACSASETNSKIALTLYNPRAQPVSSIVRVPWSGTSFTVRSPTGDPVNAQLVDISKYVQSIPDRQGNATQELVFESQLPALGFATYFLDKTPGTGGEESSNQHLPTTDTQLNGQTFSALFDTSSGNLKEVQLSSGVRISITQSFAWYAAMRGNNQGDKRASGAYVFRPNGTLPTKFEANRQAQFSRGRFANEVHQTIAPWLSQTIRVYPSKDYIEFDWVVGPIPIDDGIGKEIVSLFQTNLTTAKTFYTDANGRQMLQRVRDFRPTWPYTDALNEPVAGNYYPVNSRIQLKDEAQKMTLSVLTDRSQGGTSMQDGTAELMVHRRTLDDDGFGVGEALNEPGFDGKGLVIRGKHYVLLSSFDDSFAHRDLALSLALPPLATFSTYTDVNDYMSQFKTELSGLVNPLPPNVHLLTLEQWKDKTILVRLEHFYDANDDPANLSKPVKVSLSNLFVQLQVVDAFETTLSANQFLAEANRLQWNSGRDAKHSQLKNNFSPIRTNDFTVDLTAMQIRTFVLVVA